MKKILLSLVAVLMFAGILHAAGTSSPITGFSWDNVRKVIRFMTSDGNEIQVAEAPKAYVAVLGTTGNTPSSACTATDTVLRVCSDQAGWSVSSNSFIPYRTSDGQWRLRLNLYGNYTSANASTVNVKIGGVVFGGVQPQAVTAMAEPIGNATLRGAYVNNGQSGMYIYLLQVANTAGVSFAADVALASKPAWMD